MGPQSQRLTSAPSRNLRNLCWKSLLVGRFRQCKSVSKSIMSLTIGEVYLSVVLVLWRHLVDDVGKETMSAQSVTYGSNLVEFE